MSGHRHPLSGVLYAEDFDLPEQAHPSASAFRSASPSPEPADRSPGEAPIALEPTFSLTDLQSATERAIAEGRLLEREALARDMAARRVEVLGRIEAALRDGAARNATIAAAAAEATANAVLAAVGAILPHIAASNALCDLSALMTLLLPAMEREATLQIRANPALIEPLRKDLATVAMASSIQLEWVAIESMKAGDVAVRWQDGMMIRDTRSLCAEIGALLAPSAIGSGQGCGPGLGAMTGLGLPMPEPTQE
jgi:hypothetical protein